MNEKYLDRVHWRSHTALALLLALAIAVPEALATGPEKIVGSDECGECHKDEVRAWRGSLHFKTFADLPRRPKAREISQKLGIKRLKTESDCLQCHFTTLRADEKPIQDCSMRFERKRSPRLISMLGSR